MRILVFGAGVAGLVLAFWLTRHGFVVTVVERASGLTSPRSSEPPPTTGVTRTAAKP